MMNFSMIGIHMCLVAYYSKALGVTDCHAAAGKAVDEIIRLWAKQQPPQRERTFNPYDIFDTTEEWRGER